MAQPEALAFEGERKAWHREQALASGEAPEKETKRKKRKIIHNNKLVFFFLKMGYYILLPLLEFVPEFSKDPVIPLLPLLHLRGRTLDATL